MGGHQTYTFNKLNKEVKMENQTNTTAPAVMNSALSAALAKNGLVVKGLSATPLWVSTDEIVESTIVVTKSQKGNLVFKIDIAGQLQFVHAGAEYNALQDGEYTEGTTYQAMLDIRVPAKLTLDEVKKAYKDNDVAIERWEEASKDDSACRLVIDTML